MVLEMAVLILLIYMPKRQLLSSQVSSHNYKTSRYIIYLTYAYI